MKSYWLPLFTNLSSISTLWSHLFLWSFSRHCTEFKFLIQVPLCSFESVPRLIPWKTKSICVVFSQILNNLRARCWSIFKNYSTGFLITSILHDMQILQDLKKQEINIFLCGEFISSQSKCPPRHTTTSHNNGKPISS